MWHTGAVAVACAKQRADGVNSGEGIAPSTGEGSGIRKTNAMTRLHTAKRRRGVHPFSAVACTLLLPRPHGTFTDAGKEPTSIHTHPLPSATHPPARGARLCDPPHAHAALSPTLGTWGGSTLARAHKAPAPHFCSSLAPLFGGSQARAPPNAGARTQDEARAEGSGGEAQNAGAVGAWPHPRGVKEKEQSVLTARSCSLSSGPQVHVASSLSSLYMPV